MDTKALVRIGTFLRPKNRFEPDDRISFSGSGYSATVFSRENFHAFNPQHSRKSIAFVDGGELCVMGSAHRSLHLIRTYGHIVQSRRTTSCASGEFYLSVCASGDQDSIHYTTEVTPIKGNAPEAITIDSMDARLKDGVDRGSIGKVAGIVRKVAEIGLAKQLLERLEEGDILLFDGTLEARFDAEREALEELYASAAEKNVLVTALAKSTNLLSERGRSVTEMLAEEAPTGCWFYWPCAEAKAPGHQASIFFAKLHRRSRHAFRFELYSKQTPLVDPLRLFSFLATLSNDLSLPGYPYGMIKADRFARVSEREREYLQHVLNGAMPELERRSVHDILDSM